MNPKLKKALTNWRIILALIFIVLAVLAIHPVLEADGVTIRTISRNSSAEIAGMTSPKPTAPPVSKEKILAINQIPIKSVEDFYKVTAGLIVNDTVTIRTNKASAPYILFVKEKTEVVYLNETEIVNVTEEIFDEELNATVNKTIQKEVQKTRIESLGPEDIGITVFEAPRSNLRKGLDLQGGTRVMLEPKEEISIADMQLVIDNMKQRLNVYGISDVIVKTSKDLEGKTFVVVEIAGANEEEVKELLSKQGKFEAKIGNTSVFRGGQDITYVCMTADCAGIDPHSGCGAVSGGGQICKFRFAISLTAEAAKRQADTTEPLEIVEDNGQKYLSKPLDLYMDDELVDTLNIGSELRGKPTTDIMISGPGSGIDRQAAMTDALKNMRKLQTILKTGSLPVSLDIVKADNISPVLGKEFLDNAIMIVLFAVIGVLVVVFLGYRKIKVIAAMILTMLTEIILLLGLAGLIGWNLDIAAIAGIIIAVGTGVDHQIVIIDETLRGEKTASTWKQRIKSAFFIIFGAYFTTVVAMFPLLFAGAGLLKGFALTTILGVTIGVLITRPAFAIIVEILLKE